MVAVALFLSQKGRVASRDAAEARGLAAASTAVAFLQLVTGAFRRHTGEGLVVHIAGAVAVFLLGSLLASRLMMTPLRRGGQLLLILLGMQMALGFATLSITGSGFVRSAEVPPVQLITISLHVATGAALLAVSLILALLCRRAPEAAPA
jgi:heme A synthase